jgi:hypothetical protein
MRYKTVLPILSTAILILSLSPKLLADYSPTSGRWAEAEPYGAAYVDSFNLYQDLRDDPVRYIDPSGLDAQGDAPSPANGPKFMPTSGCGDEPLYNPRLWNDRLGDAQGPIEDSNNCYSYAVNDPYNHPPGKPQPGEQSGNPWYNNPLLPDGSININAIAAGAISDGLKSTDCDKPCPCGQHKVALVYTSSNQRGHRDYHWYRQDSNGYWSSP